MLNIGRTASALEQPRFWTLDRIADALGDGPRGTTELTRICTDTRNVVAGCCFVALRGGEHAPHRPQHQEEMAPVVGVDDEAFADGADEGDALAALTTLIGDKFGEGE